MLHLRSVRNRWFARIRESSEYSVDDDGNVVVIEVGIQRDLRLLYKRFEAEGSPGDFAPCQSSEHGLAKSDSGGYN
jgi:hypothetical protein